jgi:hypothetical protein
VSKQSGISFDWGIWLQWIMVTTVGWILGMLFIHPFGLAASGIAIGILQWVVLQQHITKGRGWILASVVGWTAGWVIALLAVPSDARLLAGIVLGASVGTAQWLVLRREVQLAGWWPIISTLAWATGLGLMPGVLVSGVMPGSMTGIALELLLRYPKQQPEE